MRAPKVKTEMRREQIAMAAMELIARHGPHWLNLARLSRAVGVVPSAIYRHFPGKEAVLDAVLGQVEGRLQESLHAARLGTADALQRLRKLLDRHLELIRKNIAIPRILFSETMFGHSSGPRKRLHRVVQNYLGQLAGIVSEGQQAGAIRPDIPPSTVAVMFLGLIHPAVILWVISEGEFDVSSHAEKAWPAFQAGIQATENRKATEGKGRHM